MIDPELARRMRAKADAAFANFRTSKSPVAPEIAGELSPTGEAPPPKPPEPPDLDRPPIVAIDPGLIGTGAPKDPGGMNKKKEGSQPRRVPGKTIDFSTLLLAALAALSLYAVIQAMETESKLDSLNGLVKSEAQEIEQLKGQVRGLQGEHWTN